jgi:tetratricopeptide (TPR) repeat protein
VLIAGSPNSVFVSCVSDEFEKASAPFPRLRSSLRHYLSRAGCHMIVQEDFPQTAEDTVEKLAKLIRGSAAVLHLVGGLPGAAANTKAVAAYLTKEPNFLASHPELRAELGDFRGVTYTQWEAYLALHYGVPLFVYVSEKGEQAQATHLNRLRLGRKYPGDERIADPAHLFGQLIGDIHTIIASVPKFTRKTAPSRILRHSPDRLFGRDGWLDALDAAWADGRLNVYTLVAWGGVGKTALVAHWVSQRLAAKGWPGVERYFDWSFYSQGTGESRQTSSDLFIQEALKFFGDPDPTRGSPWERGERLAGLIRRHRTLLVLDGIEPLQYPPGDAQAGRLKDQALEALLQGLAADNPGLCIVTTREHLKNIENQATTQEQKLDRLVKEAAVALLRHLQIVGTEEEMEAAWKDAGGHALTLQLLGRFIVDAYPDRDIRHFREVKFEEADLERQGRSAFKVMIAYERWLRSAGRQHRVELALLRLMGLFDRPMTRSCLGVLRNWEKPSWIKWLLSRRARQIWRTFGPLTGVPDKELNIALKRLGDVDLLTVTPEAIDAHPLIREYFARQLREEQPEAFRAAHSRLFDHLCGSTPDKPDTLDGLQPLYQAVAHGCLAGRQQEACDKVYFDRILRGTGADGFYSTFKLGAVGADLAAVAAFFDEPWGNLSPNLTEGDQAWLLNEAAYSLRALGRLTEALQPMRAGLEMRVQQEAWKNAAISAGNLSELEVALGRLAEAEADARQAVALADRSGDAFDRMDHRTAAADALHQSGRRGEAGALFTEAERMQKERQPGFDLVYSLPGFRYCDWLLAPAERAAWRSLLRAPGAPPAGQPQGQEGHDATCAEVERRATTTLQWMVDYRMPLLEIALDHLTLARAGLVRAILAHPLPQPALDLPHVAAAVTGFRNAGRMDYLPKGLLTAALYHYARGEQEAARARLDEAQQVAERGPMPLYLADVHLHRARLFRDRAELALAAKLIRDLGYGRRFDELADAEAALAGADSA